MADYKPNAAPPMATGYPAGAPPMPTMPGFQPQAPSQWSTGLCGCFDDCGNCCLTFCCPCITFGRIAEIVDRGSTSCGTSGALYVLIAALTGCQCLYSCAYRSKLRALYGLPESPCNDCLVHCCCETCALCQAYRISPSLLLFSASLLLRSTVFSSFRLIFWLSVKMFVSLVFIKRFNWIFDRKEVGIFAGWHGNMERMQGVGMIQPPPVQGGMMPDGGGMNDRPDQDSMVPSSRVIVVPDLLSQRSHGLLRPRVHCRHGVGFDVIGEHTGAGHDHNVVMPFGGESLGSEGVGHNLISPRADTYKYPPLTVGVAPNSHPIMLRKAQESRGKTKLETSKIKMGTILTPNSTNLQLNCASRNYKPNDTKIDSIRAQMSPNQGPEALLEGTPSLRNQDRDRRSLLLPCSSSTTTQSFARPPPDAGQTGRKALKLDFAKLSSSKSMADYKPNAVPPMAISYPSGDPPMPIPGFQSQAPAQWSTGLCDCFDDCSNCKLIKTYDLLFTFEIC
ncbi:hypothetical protein M5K25_007550 [Dendrobium thyrsiflorum]|uniref:Uncharacterized protein n=1 Tax=Dendrobium thyrsiflorum TaxID=117978 RepID=A0ABD0VFU1_DENTH